MPNTDSPSRGRVKRHIEAPRFLRDTTMPVDKKRALTDETYRKSLTPQEMAELEATLTDEELDNVSGGALGACATVPAGGGSCLASKRSNLTCGGCV